MSSMQPGRCVFFFFFLILIDIVEMYSSGITQEAF